MANYYPPVAFHFRVDIDGLTTGDKDASFQEVSGLNATVGEFTYNEGGENRFVHRLPDRITYDKLVLKRGMLVGSALIAWFRDAVESFRFDPKDLVVTLLNENHEPLEAWNFVKAYPVKWSISNFNAQGNEVVVETIELAFQYFTRMEVN
jgi:phage tail-like protein